MGWAALVLFAACGASKNQSTERSPSECSDGVDNDGDDHVDCADQDCRALAICADAGADSGSDADSDSDTDTDSDTDSGSDSDSDSDSDCVDDGSWTVDTIDMTDDTGYAVHVAAGSDGSAHVVYVNSTTGALRYATDEGGAWSVETLDDGAPGALQFDDEGVLHLFYEGYEAGGSHLMHAWIEPGGDWMFDEVDAAPSGYRVASFLDDAGAFHLVYMAGAGWGDLRLATDESGAWEHEELGRWGADGLCLVVAEGISYIGRIVAGNVRLQTWDGVTWTDDFLGVPRTSQCTLFFDADGVLHYAYDDAEGDFTIATDDGAGWSGETIASNAREIGPVVLDDAGNVHATFTRWAEGSSEAGDLAYVTNESGLWREEVVSAGATSNSDLALDALGKIHVAFRDETDTALDYAWRCR